MNFGKRNNKVKDKKELSTKNKVLKKGDKERKVKKKKRKSKINKENKPRLTTTTPTKLRAKNAKQRRISESGDYPPKNAQSFSEYQQPNIYQQQKIYGQMSHEQYANFYSFNKNANNNNNNNKEEKEEAQSYPVEGVSDYFHNNDNDNNNDDDNNKETRNTDYASSEISIEYATKHNLSQEENDEDDLLINSRHETLLGGVESTTNGNDNNKNIKERDTITLMGDSNDNEESKGEIDDQDDEDLISSKNGGITMMGMDVNQKIDFKNDNNDEEDLISSKNGGITMMGMAQNQKIVFKNDNNDEYKNEGQRDKNSVLTDLQNTKNNIINGTDLSLKFDYTNPLHPINNKKGVYNYADNLSVMYDKSHSLKKSMDNTYNKKNKTNKNKTNKNKSSKKIKSK